MKKLLMMIFITSLVLSGCGVKDNNVVKEKEAQEISKEIGKEGQKKVMDAYKTKSKPNEMMAFIEENIKNLSKENADKMINQFEVVQTEYTGKYMDTLFEENRQEKLREVFGYPFDKKNIKNIKEEDLKNLINEIYAGGYKLVNLEGDYYPIQDYEVLKKYTSYLSQEMKDYIKVMAAETNELMTNDAAIAISIEELGNRTLNTEAFLKKYPESKKRKVVGQLYEMYIRAYLHGANNTPAFDYETNKISEEVLNSYKKILSEHKETITGEVVKEYMQAIEKNDFKGGDSIINEGNRLLEKAMANLNVQSNNIQ